MTAAPALLVAAFVKPYVQTHADPVGLVLVVVVLTAVAIELGRVPSGSRAEATRTGTAAALIVLRLCRRSRCRPAGRSRPGSCPAAAIHPPLGSVVVGIVLVVAGEAMRVWSKVTLGRYFTYTVMTSADQPVITSGPYRYLRHPSYTGIMLFALGAGFVWGNWLGLAAVTVFVFLGVRYRIHVEERALLEELGDRYRTYAELHKRLIPFVW
jgi:protein-S-isoprenylcysteine O-methyltransferase Ste14